MRRAWTDIALAGCVTALSIWSFHQFCQQLFAKPPPRPPRRIPAPPPRPRQTPPQPFIDVDLTSEDSFPASDAPSWTPVISVGATASPRGE